MPYVDIADKTTLDATKTVVDNIEVDTTSIESKVDTVDTVVDRIEVDTTSIESKVNTIDTVVDRIETDTTSIESKVDTIDTNVDDIETRLGLTNDTGGSASAGTLMGKVNAVLSAGGGQKYPVLKKVAVTVPAGVNTDLDLINVTGSGVFYTVYMLATLKVDGSWKVTRDSTEVQSKAADMYGTYYYAFDIKLAIVNTDTFLTNVSDITGMIPVEFKDNFRIRLSTTSAQTATTVYAIYAIYE